MNYFFGTNSFINKNTSINIVIFCGILGLSQISYSKGGFHPTKKTMGKMASNISGLLPLTLNDKEFFDEKNEKSIQSYLTGLAKVSQNLKNPLNSMGDIGFVTTGKEFSKSISKAKDLFAGNNKSQAKFLIEYSLEYCVYCHSQRTSDKNSRIAELIGLNESKINFDKLGKAKFYTLTRQFDKASDEYEKLLLSKELTYGERMTLTPYINYLTLNLRVKKNIGSVKSFIGKLKKVTPDGVVLKSINDWHRSIKYIDNLTDKYSIDTAEGLIKKAMIENIYPMDASGVIYYIYASKIIRDWISKNQSDKKNISAKNHYLLGLCESNLNRFNFGASYYFEKAIELHPKSEISKKAYQKYEDLVVFSFSGSSGTHIPSELGTNLKRLRKLAY